MSIEASAAGSNDSRRTPAAARTRLFPIFKPGQGYWTRLGTAIGATAVILFFASFIFSELTRIAALQNSTPRFILAGVAVLILAMVTQWIMNGPKRAQFLIDTDSEMKKVNWASWPELIGSTRVVIFFMLLTALSLFIFDTQFHALFYALRVWHIAFDKSAGVITGFIIAGTLLAIGVGLLRTRGEGEAKKSGLVISVIGGALLLVWLAYAALA